MRSITVVTVVAVLNAHALGASLAGLGHQSRQEVVVKDHPFVAVWVANFSKSKVAAP